MMIEHNLHLAPPYHVGVDEAGRGPLAGPVFACAFYDDGTLSDHKNLYHQITDSKKLSAKKRKLIAGQLMEYGCYNIAYKDPAYIDKHNILQATLHAMRAAVEGLNITPKEILIDGNKAPNIEGNVPIETVIKGDSKIIQIAAASILAKYYRDTYCEKMHYIMPSFAFAQHKAYGTKQHYNAINFIGTSLFHRNSFNLHKNIS